MNGFHRWKTPSTACGRSPSLKEGGLGGEEIERLQNVGGRAMRAPTTRRKIATARCICNAGLHHCNGQMYLQPSVAPPHPVEARIARPFIPDVIITLRAGARRVLGATAKPLHPIDGKAAGLDRRSPKTSLFEGGGPPAGGGRSFRRWKALRKAPSKLHMLHMLHMHHMPDTHQAYDVFFSFFELLRSFSANTAPGKNNVPRYPAQPFSVK